jgi:hypothetical protein
MPFLALFGSLFNVVRSLVGGGLGGTPALRPIPIADRRNDRQHRHHRDPR